MTYKATNSDSKPNKEQETLILKTVGSSALCTTIF